MCVDCLVQRTDASLAGSSPGRPSLFNSFVPPVPPLPGDVLSPITDVFTSPQPPPQSEKPLPPIHAGPMDRASNDSDVSSLVVVDPISRMKGRTPSPDERSLTGDGKFVGHAKRRSMSVSDLDVFKFSVEPSPAPTLPPKDHGLPGQTWEESSSLHGILSDFKGVLSTLDPDAGSSLLDLRDPSMPGRRTASSPLFASSGQAPSVSQLDVKPQMMPPVSLAIPIVTLPTESSSGFGTDHHTSPSKDSLIAEPIVPPRKSSLRTPARSRSGSGPHQQQQAMGVGGVGSPRVGQFRYGPSPLRYKGYGNHMPSSYRDGSKLRVHHSTASTSEPSLIHNHDGHSCASCMFVFFSFSLVDGALIATALTGGSRELTTNDLVFTRFVSNPTFSYKDKEEMQDPEEHGKELAARCYQEDEGFLAKDKIAEWLGSPYVYPCCFFEKRVHSLFDSSLINKIVLRYYMDYFDFAGLRLDSAFRCVAAFERMECRG